MKAIERRLLRLEVALRSRTKSPGRDTLARMEAGGHRLGFLPPTPERLRALRGMSVVQILQTGRLRVYKA